jgi:hypothetical protein
MKTTLDLPDHLMRQVKQRAVQQGRPIKELVADYIRQGLHGSDPQLKRHPIDVATALRLEQATLMQEDCQRAGLSA